MPEVRGAGPGGLPSWGRVLAVVAHPDDESFALGALVDGFVRHGAEVAVLCLTHGEASTLRADGVEGADRVVGTGGPGRRDLGAVREAELRSAAAVLGVRETRLLGHPDGRLSDPALAADLVADVAAAVDDLAPDGLLVLDPAGGVTGHADHEAASRAAVTAAARRGLPVLAWALTEDIAARLNEEHGAQFSGYPAGLLTAVRVDRRRQDLAVREHASQAVPGSVLWRRLELSGDVEHVRLLG